MGGKAINSTVISIRVPNDLKRELDAVAAQTGKTVAAIGLELYRAYIDRAMMNLPERLSHG